NPIFKNHLLSMASTGATRNALTKRMIENLEIFAPIDIAEQRAIAAVLSSLDDKIELLREQNKTLEATAQAIFKEWFVNFNFPGATGKMIDSELGKIPEGWRIGKLGEEFKIEYGKSDKEFDADGIYPVYGAGGIVGYSNFADYRDYQVIIGCRGTCGNITLAYEDSKITHNSLIISNDWFKPFIYLYLHSVDIEKAITGSTQPQITIGSLNNIEILIPQNKIVSTFVEIIVPIFKKKRNNFCQIQTLSVFRDTLLPKLMKGELRVSGFID
ncbi:MAG: restriction endonuclease subunit S, partial [Endomicrobiaceae bacterium]|nr:restriction endonuclease subunit S [Endomicrobiaceae bacterium]